MTQMWPESKAKSRKTVPKRGVSPWTFEPFDDSRFFAGQTPHGLEDTFSVITSTQSADSCKALVT